MKHNFPFRLGCTSYVYPEELLPNVEKTAPMFDDVEIILFESLDHSNMPSRAVLGKLAKLGKEHETTFTIHFPIDKKACSVDVKERKDYADQAESIMKITEILDPFAYLLHLEFDGNGISRDEWNIRIKDVCGALQKCSGSKAKRVCVENLGYPNSWNLPVINRYGFSSCLDVGHVLRYGEKLDFVSRNLMPYTRVIHLHGWDNKNDHLSLARMDQKILERFVELTLKHYQGVLTLEVFNQNDTMESVEVLKSIWEK